ncbi:Hsp20/alpha crystallin family protein [Bacillus sp. USDA818B3_A]|uniref:Hsp20/alpha crystallin family protein n=1 Tax=Bacillus sp. USDA818B3_A TaxID=2698834 RepID=UPI00136C6749|nr:Hsp20/alpha crystallin family protein [Bacillus sp. USDA818B3_A]
MDMEKLKQWMDIAKSMQGGDFWKNIFDQEFAKDFMNEQAENSSTMGGESERSEENKTFPLVDILAGEQKVVVVIELPGVTKENIELGLNKNLLIIKGKADPIHPQLAMIHSERFYGHFERQVPLPDTISPGQLTANFWNGLLLVGYERTLEKGDSIPIK